MNTSLYIAKRYFFSRQNKNAVNIITAISLLGLLVGTAALVIVLSAMNGLEGLVRENYNTFDPDLKVTRTEGKYLNQSDFPFKEVRKLKGVQQLSAVLEERGILNFRDKEHIVSIKGVDSLFTEVSNIEQAILHGTFKETFAQSNSIVIGTGVGYYLGYSRIDLGESLSAFVLQANASASNFSNAFNTLQLRPTGIFSVQADFDAKYAIANLNYLQKAVQRPNALTQIEMRITNYGEVDAVQEQLEELLGSDYKVENRDQQQAVFYKVMKSEGLFAYLIFALILSIATFTIMGSLAMLMLDKKNDLRTLWAMGLPVQKLRQVFFNLGLFIGGGGAVIGLFIGVGLILLQQNFGLISVGQGYLVEYYPVALKSTDVVLVAVTVLGLSAFTSFISARRLGLSLFQQKH